MKEKAQMKQKVVYINSDKAMVIKAKIQNIKKIV